MFCLKDHILSAKKKRGPSNITFWIFRLFWPIGGHWEKTNQLIKTMLFAILSIDLVLINSRNRPEGPENPTGGVGGTHGGRQGHEDGRQDGHQEHL